MVSNPALTIPPRPSLCSKTFSSCLQIRAHRFALCSWKLVFHLSIDLSCRSHYAIPQWWYSSLNIGINLMPKLGNSLTRWHCMCRQNCLSNHWTEPPMRSMRSETLRQVKWFARRKERELQRYTRVVFSSCEFVWLGQCAHASPWAWDCPRIHKSQLTTIHLSTPTAMKTTLFDRSFTQVPECQ